MKTSLKNRLRVLYNFLALYQVTQLPERRDVRLELKRGDRVRFHKEKLLDVLIGFCK